MFEPIAIFLGHTKELGPISINGAWRFKELGYYILSNDIDAVVREVGWPTPVPNIAFNKLSNGIVFPLDVSMDSCLVVAPELEYTCRIDGIHLSGAIEYAICKNCGIESKGRYICTECGEVFEDMINAHLTAKWRVIR